ncbi:MAG: hypothetical protein DMF70_10610 [Acidobacteria bacterium]|nr:MAG: hypothetical protein DMF70_10610 [Acidobacteriota bacterium]
MRVALLNRNAVSPLQPNVAATATLGLGMSEHHINRKAVASVPNTWVIPFDAMPPQINEKLVLGFQ